MGNRGILHDRDGVLKTGRPWSHRNWIACRLSFKDRRRAIMAPNRYTELFFCDEAVSLAAGHRPCAECRRADYIRYRNAWVAASGCRDPLRDLLRAAEIDRVLHQARVTPKGQPVRSRARLGSLPDGTMVVLPNHSDTAWLIWRRELKLWTHQGYTLSRTIEPRMEALVLTPEPTVAAIRAGYIPEVHPSAEA